MSLFSDQMAGLQSPTPEPTVEGRHAKTPYVRVALLLAGASVPLAPGNNPLAGKITSASDFGFTQTERVIQLGLKYSF
jgi:hypothetical protein